MGFLFPFYIKPRVLYLSEINSCLLYVGFGVCGGKQGNSSGEHSWDIAAQPLGANRSSLPDFELAG
jgi:hypothetical protein